MRYPDPKNYDSPDDYYDAIEQYEKIQRIKRYGYKDVKSWVNRHDVNILSDAGFFGNSLLEIDNEIKRYNKGEKDRLHMLYQISDNGYCCFGYAVYFADTGAFAGTNKFAFFLPLDAVKEE